MIIRNFALNLVVAFCTLVSAGGSTLASIRLGQKDMKGATEINDCCRGSSPHSPFKVKDKDRSEDDVGEHRCHGSNHSLLRISGVANALCNDCARINYGNAAYCRLQLRSTEDRPGETDVETIILCVVLKAWYIANENPVKSIKTE